MLKLLRCICGISFTLFIVMSGCDRVSTEETESQVAITQLPLEENDVQQWVQDGDEYSFKNIDDLCREIDGGCNEYDKGLIEGFIQHMSRTGTGYSAMIMVMDFGTVAKAADIYNYFSSRVSPSVKAGNYDASVAIIDPSPLEGCNGYAHFKQYYLEFALSGYKSEKSEAYNNTARFMEIFEAKINAK